MRLAMTTFLVAGALLLSTHTGRAAGAEAPYDPRAAFAEVDTNHDGQIDIEEFHARLVEVFYRADADKDGVMSVGEYELLPFSGAFEHGDANGDGKISLPEFVTIRFHQFVNADSNHDTQLSVDEVVTAYETGKHP